MATSVVDPQEAISATIEAFQALQAAGKIRYFGVSNLDLDDMEAFCDVPGGDAVAVNQLLYNLSRRGIEFDLLPWLRERNVPVMAYSPIEQARLLRNAGLRRFAERHGMTPAQAALAWLLRTDDIIAIPKTSQRDRLRENVRALEITLTPEQLDELDALFPPPRHAQPLAML